MNTFRKRIIIICIGTMIFSAILLWPGVPWSARFRHLVKKVATKAEMKVSAWQGVSPKLISLSGRLTIRRPNNEPMEGVELEALDSVSGWATITNDKGEFILRDVLWYPGTKYSLIITANEYQVRRLEVAGPESYPEGEVFNLGELEFDRSCKVEDSNLPGRNSVTYVEFDDQNLEYYKALFEELTKEKGTDEEKLNAINRFVASKFLPGEFTKRYLSPREVLENRSNSKGQFALTLATIAEAGNYETRMIDLIDSALPPTAHMVTEIYYRDRWHLYDPILGAAYANEHGWIASYKELRLDASRIPPGSVPASMSEPFNHSEKWLSTVYQSGFHHYYYLRR